MNDSPSGILSAALSLPQAIEKLKIFSEERYFLAKDCFKASREASTHAFNNKSLCMKDRIMACKLRVAARVLESGLKDPEAAVTALQKMPFLNCVTVTQIMCKHGFLHAILRQNYIEILIRDDV